MANKSKISDLFTMVFAYITPIFIPIYIMYHEYLSGIFFSLSIIVLLIAVFTKTTKTGLTFRNILAWIVVFSMPIITFSWEYYNEEILGLEKEDTYFGERIDDI